MAIDIAKLNPETLELLDFYPQTMEDVSTDEIVAAHKGFTIGLAIPNGGILGVSFWQAESGQAYAKPTELLPGFPGYNARQAHIDLAIAAIDAAMLMTGQTELLIEN